MSLYIIRGVILSTKILALGIVFLFIFMAATPLAIRNTNEEILEEIENYTRKKSNQSETISSNTNNNHDLEITNIEGGLGLTFSITNKGSKDIRNIEVKSETKGSGIILPRFKRYEISLLSAGESINLQIKKIGIGLGKLFDDDKVGQLDDYSLIILNVTSPDIETFERKIAIKILGPFILVGGEFFNYKETYKGYTLFAPEYSRYTYLINNDGENVHTWTSDYIQGLGAYLLENGNLLRSDLSLATHEFASGGITGRVEIFDWNGSLIWEFEYANNQHYLHHDVEILPNGNILMIAWENKSKVDAINAGRNPDKIKRNELWPDYIIEVKPNGSSSGDIVWEWHVWDHLIQDYDSTKDNYGNVADHPELIDINYIRRDGHPDWNHINSIDYHEGFDQILLSVCHFGEIWVIDHSTTTEEAFGHTGGRYGKGGDLLYRWGNPQAYRAGDSSNQRFFGQHDAQWIEPGCLGEGNILVFNNGAERTGGSYSSVDEIAPPVDSNGNYTLTSGRDYGPEEQTWIYAAENPTDFYASHLSGAQRLPNGNTLICDGPAGRFFEVTPEKEVIWKYVNLFPDFFGNHVFKITRYSTDYPGLKI